MTRRPPDCHHTTARLQITLQYVTNLSQVLALRLAKEFHKSFDKLSPNLLLGHLETIVKPFDQLWHLLYGVFSPFTKAFSKVAVSWYNNLLKAAFKLFEELASL